MSQGCPHPSLADIPSLRNQPMQRLRAFGHSCLVEAPVALPERGRPSLLSTQQTTQRLLYLESPSDPLTMVGHYTKSWGHGPLFI